LRAELPLPSYYESWNPPPLPSEVVILAAIVTAHGLLDDDGRTLARWCAKLTRDKVSCAVLNAAMRALWKDLHYEFFWLLGVELQRVVDRMRMVEEGMYLSGLYEFENDVRLATTPEPTRRRKQEEHNAKLELKIGGLATWENGMVTPEQSPTEELQLPQWEPMRLL